MTVVVPQQETEQEQMDAVPIASHLALIAGRRVLTARVSKIGVQTVVHRLGDLVSQLPQTDPIA